MNGERVFRQIARTGLAGLSALVIALLIVPSWSGAGAFAQSGIGQFVLPKNAPPAAVASHKRFLAMTQSEREGLGNAVERIVQKVGPSVVGIRVVELFADPDGELPTAAMQRRVLLTSSGIVRSREGELVTVWTNGLPEPESGGEIFIEARLFDGQVYQAEFVATDSASGITILNVVDAPKFRPAGWTARDVKPGAFVVGVGCTYGTNHSYNMGLVSGMNRRHRHQAFPRLIVASLPANPGDVGGLLANDRGECVGMMALTKRAARPSSSSPGSSLGGSAASAADRIIYAVPATIVDHIADELRRNGTVARGALGATWYFINRAEACYHEKTTRHGLHVGNIDSRGTAHLAGVKEGDVIGRVNGRAMTTDNDLYWFAEQVQYGKVGAKVLLEVHRQTKSGTYQRLKLSVPIGSRSALGQDKSTAPDADSDTDSRSPEQVSAPLPGPQHI